MVIRIYSGSVLGDVVKKNDPANQSVIVTTVVVRKVSASYARKRRRYSLVVQPYSDGLNDIGVAMLCGGVIQPGSVHEHDPRPDVSRVLHARVIYDMLPNSEVVG